MFLLTLLVFLMSGCADLSVELPPAPPPPPEVRSGGRSASDAIQVPEGFQSYDSLHFSFQGRSFENLMEISKLCEDIYSRIMFDTNLMSFKPKENYPVIIYRDQREYHNYTGYPAWSGGATVSQPLGQMLPQDMAVKARSSIFTSEEIAKAPLLSHEITHLIFNEFMECSGPADFNFLFFINEGLATFEEVQAYEGKDREEYLIEIKPLLKRYAMPLEWAVKFRPPAEKSRVMGLYLSNGKRILFTNIQVWYWEARSVVDFLIAQRGQYNFYLFLNALKQEKDWDHALNSAYPQKWSNLQELEADWRQSL